MHNTYYWFRPAGITNISIYRFVKKQRCSGAETHGIGVPTPFCRLVHGNVIPMGIPRDGMTQHTFVFPMRLQNRMRVSEIRMLLNCNENHGQRKRYKWHILNVSITPVIIISALQIKLQWSCCRFLLVIQEKSAVKNEKRKTKLSYLDYTSEF